MNQSFRGKVICAFVAGSLVFSFSVFAGNVSKFHHPNLAEAQHLIEKAVMKVSIAQKANEYDMDGHAAKAKELLDQAYIEIKLAAEAANINKRHH